MTAGPPAAGGAGGAKPVGVYFDFNYDYWIEFGSSEPQGDNPPAQLAIVPKSGLSVRVLQIDDKKRTPTYRIPWTLRAKAQTGIDVSQIMPPAMVATLRFDFVLNTPGGYNITCDGGNQVSCEKTIGAVNQGNWSYESNWGPDTWGCNGELILASNEFAKGKTITCTLSENDFMDTDVQESVMENTYWKLSPAVPTVISAEAKLGPRAGPTGVNLQMERFNVDDVTTRWYPFLKMVVDPKAKDLSFWDTWKDRIKAMMSASFSLDTNGLMAANALRNHPELADAFMNYSDKLEGLISITNFALKLAGVWSNQDTANPQLIALGGGVNVDVSSRKAKQEDVKSYIYAAQQINAQLPGLQSAALQAERDMVTAHDAWYRAGRPTSGSLYDSYVTAGQNQAITRDRFNEASTNFTRAKGDIQEAIGKFEEKKRSVREKMRMSVGATPTANGMIANFSFGPWNAPLKKSSPTIPILGLPIVGNIGASAEVGIGAKLMVDLVFRHAVFNFLGGQLANLLDGTPVPTSDKWEIGFGGDSAIVINLTLGGKVSATVGAVIVSASISLGGEIGIGFSASLARLGELTVTASGAIFAEGEVKFWLFKLGIRFDLIKVEAPSAKLDVGRISNGIDFSGGWRVYLLGDEL